MFIEGLVCAFSLTVQVQFFLWLESDGEKGTIPVQLTLCFFLPLPLFVIPRTSRRLSIGVFSPFILCDPMASGSPSLHLLDIPLLSFLPQDLSFCLLDPLLPLSFCSFLWEYHGPTPCPVPFSRCEEVQLQPPEVWSPDPCQPHSHDFLTDAIVRKMSRMFCQAARGREVTCSTFLCLSLHRPEIGF